MGDFMCFDLLQDQNQQNQMMTWQQQQQLGFQYQNEAFSTSSSSSLSGGADVATQMGFSQSVKSLIDKQMQEFDYLFQIQNEKLRRFVEESSNQQITNVLQKYEPYMTALLAEKDQMISSANKKKLILEDYLRNTELELATWQVKARESEATVADLNNVLHQMRGRSDGADEESRFDQDLGNDRCRLCRARRSCVVFLPCRHLCSCEFCEGFVSICPVCETAKECSVEVFFD